MIRGWTPDAILREAARELAGNRELWDRLLALAEWLIERPALPADAGRLRALVDVWKASAATACHFADNDPSNNSSAWLIQARVWYECATQLLAALAPDPAQETT